MSKGNGMEVRRVATAVAREKGFIKRKPVIVTKEMRKRAKPTLRDYLWIYNTQIAFVSIIVFFGPILIVFSASRTRVLLSLLAIIAAGVAGVAAIALIIVMSSTSSPTISYRRTVVLAERRRRQAPHASRRRARAADTDFAYHQFSARMTKTDKHEITVEIMEHAPWKGQRYKAMAADTTPEVLDLIRPPDKHYWAPPEKCIFALKKEKSESVEEFEIRVKRLYDACTDLATIMEERAYETACESFQIERIALEH